MKNARKTTSLLFWLVFLAIISFAGSLIAYVSAYFTASAEKSGDVFFHDISLEINTANTNNALFAANIGSFMPGDSLTLNNISIKNTGTADIYTLLNITISVSRPGYTNYNIDYWKNLSGTDVNVANISSNTTKATNLATATSQSLSFSYVFDGDVYDNTFRNATASVTVRAVGIQTENLEQIDSISDSALIASYMLIEEFYTPTIQNVVDMQQFETQKVVHCDKPSATFNDGVYDYDIYNVDLGNAKEGDTIYVQAKDADMVFIVPGYYDLETLMTLYPNNLPEGTISAYGQTVTSFTMSNGMPRISPMSSASESQLEFTGLFTVATIAQADKTPVVRVYVEPQEDLPEIVGGLGVYKIDYSNIKTKDATFDTPMEVFPTEDGYSWEVSNYSIVNTTENSTVTVYVRGGGQIGMLPRHTTLVEFNGMMNGEIEIPQTAVLSFSQRANDQYYCVNSFEIQAGESLDFAVATIASSYEEGFNNPLVSVYVQPTKELPACEGMVSYLPTEDGTGYVAFGSNDIIYGEVVIPNTYNGKPVKEIACWGFQYLHMDGLYFMVSLGENIEKIGEGAFLDSNNMLGIIFDENSKLRTIGNYAFCDCDGLTTITIPSSVTTIGDSAFEFCKSLSSITIPSSVTTINYYAFASCTSLTTVTFEANSQLTTIGGGAFTSCTSLTTVTFAANSQLTTIGTSAFYDCDGLSSITIPSSVTTIGNYVFADCTSLTTVTFAANSQLTTIERYAFAHCTSLTTISIPSSVTTIVGYAFNDCANLTSLTLNEKEGCVWAIYDPKWDSTLGEYVAGTLKVEDAYSLSQANLITYAKGNYIFKQASNNSDKLTFTLSPDGNSYIVSGLTDRNIQSIFIPAKYNGKPIVAIDNKAFRNLTSLKSITLAANSQLTTIGEEAFEHCDSLSSITIPSSVTTIGTYAFYYCRSLKTVTFAANSQLTTIGAEAFEGCRSLTTISIPSSVTIIYPAAFYNSGLTSATLNAKEDYTWFARSGSNDKIYELSANGIASSLRIAAYYFEQRILVEQDSIFYISYDGEEYSVSGNAEKSISTANILSSINGKPVTTIENQAFTKCNSLSTVNFEANSQLTIIGAYAFEHCDSLSSISIPSSVTTIGAYAFAYCTSLTTINIPNSVATIGDSAFYDCGKLSTVNFEANSQLTTIGDYAFAYCTSLTTINIPNSVTTIEAYAFYHCDSLSSISIPSSVTTIGDGAFQYCESLTSITLNAKENHKWQVYVSYSWKDCSTLTNEQILTYAKGKYQFRQVSL